MRLSSNQMRCALCLGKDKNWKRAVKGKSQAENDKDDEEEADEGDEANRSGY
jgi:hypothetical protein